MLCPLCQVVIEAGAGSLISHLLDLHPDESAAISAVMGGGTGCPLFLARSERRTY